MALEKEFNIKLVQIMENYPCLYNYTLAEYSSKDMSDKSWAEIAEQMGDTVSNCKEKWRNIRTVFVRKIKQKHPGTARSSRYKPYYLGKLLHFLRPFVKAYSADPPQGNICIPSPTLDAHQTDSDIEENDEFDSQSQLMQLENEDINSTIKIEVTTNEEQSPSAIAIAEETDPLPKRVRRVSGINRHFKRKVSEMEKACSYNYRYNKQEDEYKRMFLISLLPELQEFNPEEMRKFKRKVLTLIDDILAERPVCNNMTSNLHASTSFAIPFSYNQTGNQEPEQHPNHQNFNSDEELTW